MNKIQTEVIKKLESESIKVKQHQEKNILMASIKDEIKRT